MPQDLHRVRSGLGRVPCLVVLVACNVPNPWFDEATGSGEATSSGAQSDGSGAGGGDDGFSGGDDGDGGSGSGSGGGGDSSTDGDSATGTSAGSTTDASGDGSGGTATPSDGPTTDDSTTDDSSGASGSTQPCGGAWSAGFCWYYGDLYESCTDVCSTHGGYDQAGTRDYVGSGAPDDTRCGEIMPLVGVNRPVATVISSSGHGCYWFEDDDTVHWERGGPTQAGSRSINVRRLCACLE